MVVQSPFHGGGEAGGGGLGLGGGGRLCDGRGRRRRRGCGGSGGGGSRARAAARPTAVRSAGATPRKRDPRARVARCGDSGRERARRGGRTSCSMASHKGRSQEARPTSHSTAHTTAATETSSCSMARRRRRRWAGPAAACRAARGATRAHAHAQRGHGGGEAERDGRRAGPHRIVGVHVRAPTCVVRVRAAGWAVDAFAVAATGWGGAHPSRRVGGIRTTNSKGSTAQLPQVLAVIALLTAPRCCIRRSE